MSAEKHVGHRAEKHERQHSNKELERHKESLEHGRHEAAEKASRSHERTRAEALRSVEQEAVSGKELAPTRQENVQPASHTRAEEKLHSFNTTMHHVRQRLSKPNQAFSKVIHQPVVEKVSDVAGKTIARPSGIIGGTVAAGVGILSVYGVARFAGFSLSGSEMPLLLVAGFAVGLFVEWLTKAARSVFSPKSNS